MIFAVFEARQKMIIHDKSWAFIIFICDKFTIEKIIEVTQVTFGLRIESLKNYNFVKNTPSALPDFDAVCPNRK